MAKMKYAEDRKEQIYQAFLELMSEKTYESITTREIAERSGLAYSALYYYFKNKDDILMSYYDQYSAGFVERMEEAIRAASSRGEALDVASFTNLVVEAYFAGEDSSEASAVDVNFLALALREDRLGDHYRQTTTAGCEVAARGLATCGIEVANPMETAQTICALIIGIESMGALYKDATLAGNLIGCFGRDYAR